mgnify:CR=1 FL=1
MDYDNLNEDITRKMFKGKRLMASQELPIFKLQRKLNNYKLGNKGQQFKINYTSIRNIELIGEDYATCITVDNDDKLFLTTILNIFLPKKRCCSLASIFKKLNFFFNS